MSVFQIPKDATTLAPLWVMSPEWRGESVQLHPNDWLQNWCLEKDQRLVPNLCSQSGTLIWFLGGLMTMFFSGEEALPPSRRFVSRLKTKPCSCCVTKLSKKTCHVGMGPSNMATHATPEVHHIGSMDVFGEGYTTCILVFQTWVASQVGPINKIIRGPSNLQSSSCSNSVEGWRNAMFNDGKQLSNIPWQNFNPHWLDRVTSWICFVTRPCTSYIFMHIITMNLFKINGFPEHYSTPSIWKMNNYHPLDPRNLVRAEPLSSFIASRWSRFETSCLAPQIKIASGKNNTLNVWRLGCIPCWISNVHGTLRFAWLHVSVCEQCSKWSPPPVHPFE